jgi:hypothetical protein
MNFVKSLSGSGNQNQNQNQNQTEQPLHTQSQGNEGNGGLMGRLNNAAGGGQSSEANEGVYFRILYSKVVMLTQTLVNLVNNQMDSTKASIMFRSTHSGKARRITSLPSSSIRMR